MRITTINSSIYNTQRQPNFDGLIKIKGLEGAPKIIHKASETNVLGRTNILADAKINQTIKSILGSNASKIIMDPQMSKIEIGTEGEQEFLECISKVIGRKINVTEDSYKYSDELGKLNSILECGNGEIHFTHSSYSTESPLEIFVKLGDNDPRPLNWIDSLEETVLNKLGLWKFIK